MPDPLGMPCVPVESPAVARWVPVVKGLCLPNISAERCGDPEPWRKKSLDTGGEPFVSHFVSDV